ncbi:DNA-binding protein [Nocardioides sp. zg-DK7169]|uniref:DNA-binding protein n=1 Tax=Nocardioides sp. zg-DK7169 TaxID=2736600 RepID=UPI00155266EF|nr:DNA-binding protein [Nocardioides sp. zg-DK7169]NPC95260.1 DNA-binding protein [Nocardioides sp. zg-DK7169]
MEAERPERPDKIDEQRRLYGEPIGALVRRVTAGLGLNQSRVAEILGLSPPMLSQLVSGHRVKIGNPLAVSRLQSLLGLVEEAPTLSGEAVQRRLEEIRTHHGTLSTGQFTHVPESSAVVRKVLRAVASGQELDRAAEVLADVAPGLAELVRVYGTGSEAEAARHFAAISHVM